MVRMKMKGKGVLTMDKWTRALNLQPPKVSVAALPADAIFLCQ